MKAVTAMALPKKRYTPEEYFAIERDSGIRHELLDGEIYAMTGASPDHERIVSDVDTSLKNQLRGKNCEVFISGLRLKVTGSNYFYGDLSVTCGEPLFIVEAGLNSLTNPTLVIEVLSPSTERYDRTTKYTRYKTIESLQQYVLIWQDRPIVEVFTRQSSDTWLHALSQGLDAVAALESIGCTLLLSDVYERVTVEPLEDDVE